VAAPLAAVWLVVSLWLGKRQSAMARNEVDSPSTSEPSVVKTPA
jgi:hypothetical protein